MSISLRSAAVAAVVVGATLVGGGVAVAKSAALTATATDTVVSSAAGHTLSNTGGATTTILSLSLPAGSYVLSAQGDMVNWARSDYTRCKIAVNGTQVAGVSSIVGNPAPVGSMGPAGYVTPFSLAAGVVAPSGGATATVQCWHDTTGTQPLIDAGTSLVAHRTTSLLVATQ